MLQTNFSFVNEKEKKNGNEALHQTNISSRRMKLTVNRQAKHEDKREKNLAFFSLFDSFVQVPLRCL